MNSSKKVEELLLSPPCVDTLKRVAMEGTGVSYDDDKFVDSLPEEWKVHLSLAEEKDAWWDELEFQIRKKLCSEMIPQILKQTSVQPHDLALLEEGMEELLFFTKVTEQVCYYLSFKRKNSGGLCANVLKKLPFAVVEDVLDLLTIQPFVYWKFCHDCFLPFWLSPSSKNDSTKLVVIRMCNKLLVRLDQKKKSSILLFLSKIFPLSERSAVNVLGRFHTTNVVSYDTTTESTTSSLYQPFWKLQSYFTNPNLLVPPSTTTAADFATWKETLNQFTSDWNSILTEWESSPISLSEEKESDNTTTGNGGSSSNSTQHYWKYLTSPQLFPLQMETDAELRLHVLVQFLVLEPYWSLKIKQQQSTALYTATWKEVVKDKILPRIQDCISSSSHQKKNLLPVLNWILTKREVIWKEWKRTKCSTPIEKPRLPKPASPSKDVGDDQSINNLAKEHSKVFSVCISRDSLKKQHHPEVEIPTFCQPYVDALDPEAGIEDEYHPKHDPIFCWRALRLLCRHTVPKNVSKSTGNFEKLLRSIYTTDFPNEPAIPGNAPTDESDDSDNDENNNADDQQNNDDNESDDEEENDISDDESEPSVRIQNKNLEEQNENNDDNEEEKSVEEVIQESKEDNTKSTEEVSFIESENKKNNNREVTDKKKEVKKDKKYTEEEEEEEGTIDETKAEIIKINTDSDEDNNRHRKRKRYNDESSKKSQQHITGESAGESSSKQQQQSSNQRYSRQQQSSSNRPHWRGGNDRNNNNNNNNNSNNNRGGNLNNNNNRRRYDRGNNNTNNAGGGPHHAHGHNNSNNNSHGSAHHHGGGHHHSDRNVGPQRRRPRRN